MTTIYCIICVVIGVIIGSFVKSPITIYKGSVRIKQKGRNNIQENEITAEITAGMKRREVVKAWKELRKLDKNKK